MAGYLFNLGAQGDVASVFEHGVYSTYIPNPDGWWRLEAEATFADYATMAQGDHIYLFKDRVVYGVGELVEVGPDCKYRNFPASSEPVSADYDESRDHLLWDRGPESVRQRWVCTFRPSPWFFRRGLDMDDLLESNPSAFRMLRANWKVSFIKFDDEEDQAFLDALLRANRHVIEDTPDGLLWANPIEGEPAVDQVYAWSDAGHQAMADRDLDQYRLSAAPILKAAADGERIKHEMAVEAGILTQLAAGDDHTLQTFGIWTYLSHQVMASPFKPIDWVDKMDLFGQASLAGYAATIARYLVGEVKKDVAEPEAVDQVMKYVDWVKDEYANGDYSMIHAFLIAYDFPEALLEHARERSLRGFTVGRRPPRTAHWNQLQLVRYRHDQGRLNFENVPYR